jgi:hypothetical protein
MRLAALAPPLLALCGCLTQPGDEPGGTAGPGGKADDGDAAALFDWPAIAARCGAPAEGEPHLRGTDFRWWYSRAELLARFDEIYVSEARLFERARHEPTTGAFVLPHVPSWGGRVELSRRLVVAVSRQLTSALAERYAEGVFFPDMGHSHFFIPQAHWDATYAGTPVSQFSAMYTRLLDDPALRMLYHTAEQLQTHDDAGALLPDEHLQWRFYNRNPVGDNDALGRLEMPQNLESSHNTVNALAGHKYFSAGFNVSANAAGCFPYLHGDELRYFDLSLSDLP